jgi:exonuclease III
MALINTKVDVNLSFSVINCNSLNMTVSGSFQQKLKVYGIVKLKTDVIFLSDIRLSNRQGIRDISALESMFKVNPYCSYKCYFNSSKNKRGAGILLKHDLPFSDTREVADPGENFLLLSTTFSGNRYTLGAVYGPNGNNPGFFNELGDTLWELGNDNIILGGDWNCVWSRAALTRNQDLLNMTAVPNSGNSAVMRKCCNKLDLTDPFRALHPSRCDFSYTPRCITKKNRSRLDFFVVSNRLLRSVTTCTISRELQNKLFDHKAIFLNFKVKKQGIVRPTIDNTVLKDPEIELIVGMSAAETYLRHSAIENIDRQALLLGVGTARSQLRSAGPPHVPSTRRNERRRPSTSLRNDCRC